MSTERLPSGLTMGRSRTRSSRVWGRVEQTFAWEDKCKRLLLRCEHIQQRHVGMKLLAYILINLRAFCGVSNSQPVKYEPHLYRAEGMQQRASLPLTLRGARVAPSQEHGMGRVDKHREEAEMPAGCGRLGGRPILRSEGVHQKAWEKSC